MKSGMLPLATPAPLRTSTAVSMCSGAGQLGLKPAQPLSTASVSRGLTGLHHSFLSELFYRTLEV